jgi:ABC-type Co2+ transport system permease subunit
MDRIVTKLRELTTSDNSNLLMATFLATLLATTAAAFFLSWATAGTGEVEWLRRLVASLGATLIYAGIAAGVFYVFLPDSRKAFQNVWQRRK